MIKILHYIPAFSTGGIESLVMAIYQSLDHTKFQFDFLVENDVPDYYKKIISSYGGNIYQLPKMTDFKFFLNYLKELKKVFKNNKYDVFHCHSWETRPFPLIFSLFYNVKVRIVHAHFVDFNEEKNFYIKKFFQKIGIFLSNVRISCSEEAGKATYNLKDYHIINNGIDIERYKFDSNMRMKYRKKYNISDECIVYINVGRLTLLKNQMFLLDVFHFLHKKNKNTKLFILGDGEEKKNIFKKIKRLRLDNSVFVISDVFDVNNYLSMSDIFIFPSISEGLGLAYIEAQANQLFCYVSDGVPAVATKLPTCIKIELSKTASEWADIISANVNFVRKADEKYRKKLNEYSIKATTLKYQKLIFKAVNLKE